MKSTTIHRSGLTKERMQMFDDSIKPANINENIGIPQYKTDVANFGTNSEKEEFDSNQNDELDLLYNRASNRRFQKSSVSKTPNVYLGIGFIAGVLFTLVVCGIIFLSSKTDKTQIVVSDDKQTIEEQISENAATKPQNDIEASIIPEKYVIKSGDTLDKIVFKIFGKYDNQKIEQIQTINNIKNPASIQIGQEIIIPR